MIILLASRNPDKLREVVDKVASSDIQIISLADFPDLPEVEEDGETLEANAAKKALTLHQISGLPTIADDTGLEVSALSGAPGVYSSRYAGPRASYADNVKKLLKDMTGIPMDQRQARFRCVIAYAADNRIQVFEGKIEGMITTEPVGISGFGYDPVFFVDEEGKTLAQLGLAQKNGISHRGRALDAWVEYIRAKKVKSA